MKTFYKQEWHRGVYREVFRRGGHLVKRFHIPPGTRRVHRDWEREHEALVRLGEPASLGFRERQIGPDRFVVFRRAFVEGSPVEEVDPVRLAECLAAMHRRGVVALDPHPGNLLHTPEGRLQLVDFGRAVVRPAGSLRLAIAIGHELYRLERETWTGPDREALIGRFLAAYKQHGPRHWWLVRLSRRLHWWGRSLRS